jgi:hypothetical protein
MGLLHVALTSSGAVEVATITLTPLGRAFAEHLANGNAVLERAKRERFP